MSDAVGVNATEAAASVAVEGAMASALAILERESPAGERVILAGCAAPCEIEQDTASGETGANIWKQEKNGTTCPAYPAATLWLLRPPSASAVAALCSSNARPCATAPVACAGHSPSWPR